MSEEQLPREVQMALYKAVNLLIVEHFIRPCVDTCIQHSELGFRIKLVMGERQRQSNQRVFFVIRFRGPLSCFGTDEEDDVYRMFARTLYRKLGRLFGLCLRVPPDVRGTMLETLPLLSGFSVDLIRCNDKLDSAAKRVFKHWVSSTSSIRFLFVSEVDGENSCRYRRLCMYEEGG